MIDTVRMRGAAGWGWVALAGLYAAFALVTAFGAALALLGLADPVDRAAPALFVLHALAGSGALIAGTVQLRLTGPLPARCRPGRGCTAGWAGPTCTPPARRAG